MASSFSLLSRSSYKICWISAEITCSNFWFMFSQFIAITVAFGSLFLQCRPTYYLLVGTGHLCRLPIASVSFWHQSTNTALLTVRLYWHFWCPQSFFWPLRTKRSVNERTLPVKPGTELSKTKQKLLYFCQTIVIRVQYCCLILRYCQDTYTPIISSASFASDTQWFKQLEMDFALHFKCREMYALCSTR